MSPRWQDVGDTVSDLTGSGIEPQTFRADTDVLSKCSTTGYVRICQKYIAAMAAVLQGCPNLGWIEFESAHELLMNLNFIFFKLNEFEFRFIKFNEFEFEFCFFKFNEFEFHFFKVNKFEFRVFNVNEFEYFD